MNTLLLQSMEQVTGTNERPRIAVSYVRVSTKRQAEKGGTSEGFSIPAQKAANQQKAESMGAFVVKEFVDRGESAKTADRPALQEMLEYIKQHKVDYVIVHKLDRLARNRADDVEISRAIQQVNTRLISTSESFDDSTPSGSLMHGIMSSVAEFYSNNLAHEVKKGMLQKVKNGGTPSKAPLGYKNVPFWDEHGREARTVELDAERAPLITKAFKLYAKGSYTVRQLAYELATEGLTTLETPKIPSKPVTAARVNKILTNPYYKGLVKYSGVYHDGSHPKLVDEHTWQQVQDVLKSHTMGERTRKHPHFLKSTVWCGSCEGRLVVQMSRGKLGGMYEYFMCSERHSKRKNCQQRAVQIYQVEKQIEQHYASIYLSKSQKENLKTILYDELDKRRKEELSSQGNIRLEKDKIVRKQKKLLEAHYADAISLDMFKEEQAILQQAMTNIETKLSVLEQNYELVKENLDSVLEIAANAGKLYASAPEHIKRMLNQVFFEKVLVHAHDEVKPARTSAFEAVLSAQTKQLAISGELSCQTLSDKMISHARGLSNILLAGVEGFEPPNAWTKTMCLTTWPHPNTKLVHWPVYHILAQEAIVLLY